MMMSTDQLNYLNVGLMLLSCVAAFAFPFELFLFSYAVLGPLHYLTEISWLHDRNYFAGEAGGKRSQRERRAVRHWLLLVTATMVVLLYGLFTEKALGEPISPGWEIAMFYLVFVTAALLTLVKDTRARVAVILLALVSLGIFNASSYYALLAFFLVTIIHVLVFTGAFILLGSLRGRSMSGLLSLAVFILCSLSFFVYLPDATGHTVGEYVRNSHGSFRTLNEQLLRLFRLGTGASTEEIYQSSAGLMVMRLIAFAYTYHYLNWFSKTSVIRWHEIPRRRTALIASLWLASLAVYAYSYAAGMAALYFLSILHVMLEFPLNHQTFAAIGRELRALKGWERTASRVPENVR